jgi:hypothetical protein
MKFKTNKEDGDRELTVTDDMGDSLEIISLRDKHIYIGVNGGVFIQLTKRRALAVAKAIIEELS